MHKATNHWHCILFTVYFLLVFVQYLDHSIMLQVYMKQRTFTYAMDSNIAYTILEMLNAFYY
jgi:hypothetical protein